MILRSAHKLSKEEQEKYKRLYHLYEYTDDICVLEDNPLYPSLLNYVKTGLLTDEELNEALEFNKDDEQ